MSFVYLVLLGLALVLLVAAEWPRLQRLPGRLGWRGRHPSAHPPRPRVGRTHKEKAFDDDFEGSVRRDLDSLPTVDEDELKRML